MSFRDFGISVKLTKPTFTPNRNVFDDLLIDKVVQRMTALKENPSFEKASTYSAVRVSECPTESCICIENHASIGSAPMDDIRRLGTELSRRLEAPAVSWQMYHHGWRIELCLSGRWETSRFESEPEGIRYRTKEGIIQWQEDDRTTKLAILLSRHFGVAEEKLLNVLRRSNESASPGNSTNAMIRHSPDDPRRVFDLLDILHLHHPYSHVEGCSFVSWEYKSVRA